jgi:glycosyltransferase 2 family protein
VKQNLRRVLVVMLLGVALYGAFVVYRGLDKMEGVLRTFGWWSFAAACALAFGNYVLRFLKWEFYLARLSIRGIPKMDSFLTFLSGFVLTVTPGKVGEVFKSLVLHETYGVPIAKTAPIVIAERVTDLIGIIVLIVIGSLGFSGGLLWAGIGAFLVTSLIVVIASRSLSMAIIGRVEKMPGKLGKIGPKLHASYDSLATMLKPANLVVPTLLSIVAWSLECLSLWVILQGFAQSTSVALCMFFYATSTLAGALVPVPGGLGVTEGALQEQLMNLGKVPETASTAAMILVRFATLWFAVLVGFVALSILKRRHPGLLAAEPRAPSESPAAAPTRNAPEGR